MITGNITYIESTGRLAIIQVQILEVWNEAGRTWAKVKALDCQPFTGLRNGHPYDSNWTVVDNKRLKDVAMLVTPIHGRMPRKERERRRMETGLLQEYLLGGGHERLKPA